MQYHIEVGNKMLQASAIASKHFSLVLYTMPSLLCFLPQYLKLQFS